MLGYKLEVLGSKLEVLEWKLEVLVCKLEVTGCKLGCWGVSWGVRMQAGGAGVLSGIMGQCVSQGVVLGVSWRGVGVLLGVSLAITLQRPQPFRSYCGKNTLGSAAPG